ncbi:MAG: c-type cytochrome [Burkholderiaceae bacterium]
MLRTSIVVAAALAAPLAVQAQNTSPDPAKGQAIVEQVCVACHGVDGNSGTPANPKLASQHYEYLLKQLADYKVAEGAEAAARVDPIMAGFAAMLSEEDMRNVSAYYAAQALKPAAAKNRDYVELGQRIYRAGIADKGVPACSGCHSPNGAGLPAQYPRLHGQYPEYTEAQLVAFRQGHRQNSAEMTTIAERMSDREIQAVSDYIAGLR